MFSLAHEPLQTKGKGMLMFFTHLSTGHRGIVCAMATEPIPVRATFPKPVSSVTISFWGSTGTPALLEAFDAEGKMVDHVSLESVPGRKTPGDPVPIFTLTVRASRITYIQFSGPREGEYLAADEVRFTPIEGRSELTRERHKDKLARPRSQKQWIRIIGTFSAAAPRTASGTYHLHSCFVLTRSTWPCIASCARPARMSGG